MIYDTIINEGKLDLFESFVLTLPRILILMFWYKDMKNILAAIYLVSLKFFLNTVDITKNYSENKENHHGEKWDVSDLLALNAVIFLIIQFWEFWY